MPLQELTVTRTVHVEGVDHLYRGDQYDVLHGAWAPPLPCPLWGSGQEHQEDEDKFAIRKVGLGCVVSSHLLYSLSQEVWV